MGAARANGENGRCFETTLFHVSKTGDAGACSAHSLIFQPMVLDLMNGGRCVEDWQIP